METMIADRHGVRPLGSRSRSLIPKLNPNREFKTTIELLDFVRERYFARLRRGAPFMVVARFMKSHITRCDMVRSESEYRLNETLYIGVLADADELVTIEDKPFGGSLVVKTRSLAAFGYHAYPKALADQKYEKLEFLFDQIADTKMNGRYEPPYPNVGRLTLKKGRFVGLRVAPFTVAVGLSNIEKLCDYEGADVLAYYIAACSHVGIKREEGGQRELEV